MQNAIESAARNRNFLRELAQNGEQRWQRLLGYMAQPGPSEDQNPPAHFHFPYMVGRPTPYECCDAGGRVQHASGGVLRTNQVVWLEQPLPPEKMVCNVTAFAPSAGFIHMNTRGLSVVRHSGDQSSR